MVLLPGLRPLAWDLVKHCCWICIWCRRTSLKIMIYAINMIVEVSTRKLTAMILRIFLFMRTNLMTVIRIQINQKLRTTLAMPRLVTMSWYRKCRCTARNLSQLMAVIVNNETPASSQPKDSDITPATQWAFMSPTICEIRQTENEGWANIPTARSEVARDRSNPLDGVWRDGVFHTAEITSTFPQTPGSMNMQFKTEQIKLWMYKFSGSSKESVKNWHGLRYLVDWFSAIANTRGFRVVSEEWIAPSLLINFPVDSVCEVVRK